MWRTFSNPSFFPLDNILLTLASSLILECTRYPFPSVWHAFEGPPQVISTYMSKNPLSNTMYPFLPRKNRSHQNRWTHHHHHHPFLVSGTRICRSCDTLSKRFFATICGPTCGLGVCPHADDTTVGLGYNVH